MQFTNSRQNSILKEETAMTLAQMLTNLRKEKGLSQQEVAEYVIVSRQAVSRWEQGRSNPSTENLISLAKLYQIPVDTLVGISDGAEHAADAETNTTVDTKPTQIRTSSKKRKFIAAIIGVAILLTGVAVGFSLAVLFYNPKPVVINVDSVPHENMDASRIVPTSILQQEIDAQN
jgi:transcriptional regulator with XRE-family HTH domain